MQPSRSLRIGTRKSPLALAQAEIVRQKLMAAFAGLVAELVPMTTTGDNNPTKVLADIGGKGLFTKELEEGLLSERIDIAVHSLKDMESFLPPGLMIAAILERGDPRDVLIAPQAVTFANLKTGARIGTSSPRRAAQIKMLRPDMEVLPFRGNVTTRIAKLKNGEVDATLLALAGLKRLGLEQEATEILAMDHFIPAVGQGTLAIECREKDEDTRQMLQAVHHEASYLASMAERSMLAALGGSCRTPIAGYAHIEGDTLTLRAMIATYGGEQHVNASRAGAAKDASAIGEEVASELLANGGKDWLA